MKTSLFRAEFFMALLMFILVFRLSRQAAVIVSARTAGAAVTSSGQSAADLLSRNPSVRKDAYGSDTGSWADRLRAVFSRSEDAPMPSPLKPVVALDAGHGGFDPGKISESGTLEKDINLQIALRVKQYLEASDVEVVMTRDTDTALSDESDSGKKTADMRNRCQLINNASPALTVSIHQNSYHEEYVKGAQVFYYKSSEKGRRLAEILQKRFDYVSGDANTRSAKANDSYYLLLHVRSPIVIVECGFLSNRDEAALLNTEVYQDRVAWTIHMGIMEYLNTQ